MGKIDRLKSGVRVLFVRGICSTITLSLTFMPLTPVFAGDALDVDPSRINRGAVSEGAPDVDSICASLENASSGNFVGKDGKLVTFTDSSCASMKRRDRTADNCQISLDKILAGLSGEQKQKKIDSLCQEGRGTLVQGAAAYCAIRAAAADGQATRYCDAYTAAKKAKGKMSILLGLDIAAAGLCWNEHRVLKQQIKNGIEVSKKKGACSKAGMVAGLAEFADATGSLLGKKREKVDSDGNFDKANGGLTGTMGLALKAGLSGAAIKIGVCASFPSKLPWLCGKTEKKQAGRILAAKDAHSKSGTELSAAAQAECDAEKELVKAQGTLTTANAKLAQAQTTLTTAETTLKTVTDGCLTLIDPVTKAESCRRVETAQKNVEAATITFKAANDMVTAAKNEVTAASANVATYTGKVAEAKKGVENSMTAFKNTEQGIQTAEGFARVNVAHSSAIIFSALSVMRVAAMSAAGSTMKRSKDILQSMFSAENGGTKFGTSGFNSMGTNIYSTTGGGSFAQTGGNQPTRNEAMANTPEAFLAPPGSEHGAEMQNVADQIPKAALEKAAEGGASGVGGMISGIAGGGGETASQIHAVTATAFANLPKEDGGYGGGGGKAMAKSGGESTPELNLKGLFGEAEKEEKPGAESELAYRTIASEEDIWHSQNPKGHNLFQIISDRYDTAQRKLRVD